MLNPMTLLYVCPLVLFIHVVGKSARPKFSLFFLEMLLETLVNLWIHVECFIPRKTLPCRNCALPCIFGMTKMLSLWLVITILVTINSTHIRLLLRNIIHFIRVQHQLTEACASLASAFCKSMVHGWLACRELELEYVFLYTACLLVFILFMTCIAWLLLLTFHINLGIIICLYIAQ